MPDQEAVLDLLVEGGAGDTQGAGAAHIFSPTSGVAVEEVEGHTSMRPAPVVSQSPLSVLRLARLLVVSLSSRPPKRWISAGLKSSGTWWM